MDSLMELFEDELKDTYSAENQLLKAMPKMAKKASNEALKAAFEEHRLQSENQVKRLEDIGTMLGIKLKGKTCMAMKGLVEEASETLKEKGNKSVLDSAIIASAQRCEHYEIAAYGTLVALAKQMGHKDAVKLLTESMNEEKATDKKLTGISVGEILKSAPTGHEDEAM